MDIRNIQRDNHNHAGFILNYFRHAASKIVFENAEWPIALPVFVNYPGG